MNLEFQIDTTEFTMKLISGKTSETSLESAYENVIAKAVKRLNYFYPERYELKTTVEPDMMMTYLKIELNGSVDSEINSVYNTEQIAYATV